MPRHEDSWKQVPRSVWRRMKERDLPHTTSLEHLPDNKWSIRFHAAESMQERNNVVEEALEQMSVEDFAKMVGLSPDIIEENYVLSLSPREKREKDRKKVEKNKVHKKEVWDFLKENTEELLKRDPPITLAQITREIKPKMEEAFGQAYYTTSGALFKVLNQIMPEAVREHAERLRSYKEEQSNIARQKKERIESLLSRVKALISRGPEAIEELEKLLEQIERL